MMLSLLSQADSGGSYIGRCEKPQGKVEEFLRTTEGPVSVSLVPLPWLNPEPTAT